MSRSRLKNLLFWSLCFILPIAMLAAQSVWAGTYPFGAQSFLADDLRYQYIDFFTWYRNLLNGQGSIFYSFAQGMGSNTWGLYSYYLASPFNLVTLLFDQDHLTLAIYVIVALKLGCMQLAMTWYLKKRFSLSPVWALTLGLCYTWSTWTVTNLRNPLWLDALIILPLAAWCCHKLIRDGSFAPLAAVIAIDVITCWYMAYITLLFLCLFVLFELADHVISGARISVHWIAGRAGRFTLAIVLGLLLSSWTFVPTVLAMLGGSGSSQISPLASTPRAILQGFLPSQWAPDAVPQFFAGVIPLALSVCFLLTPKVDWKFKLLSFTFLAFMVASSAFGALQFVWCGMRVPNGFYSRTAFLFTFLLIWTAAYYLSVRSDVEELEEKTALPTAYIALNAALLLFACADLGINAHSAWKKIYYDYPQEQHNAYVEEADAQFAQIRQMDAEPSTVSIRRITESVPRSMRASRTASTRSRPIRPPTPLPPYGSSTVWDTAAWGSSRPSTPRPCWQWIACSACATSALGERPQDTATPASQHQATALLSHTTRMRYPWASTSPRTAATSISPMKAIHSSAKTPCSPRSTG